MNGRRGRDRCSYAVVLIVALLLCFLSISTVPADDRGEERTQLVEGGIALSEVLSQTGAVLQWDPYRNRGAIVRGDTILTFAVGEPVTIEDLNVLHNIEPPIYREGTLVFSQRFLQLAMSIFPRREDARRIVGIFIDPGHGGKDPGAVGTIRDGDETRTIQEKQVVLDVGRRLRDRLLARYPDKDIRLSRDTDIYLTLEERTNLANGIKTASDETVVFVSIHANASLNRNAQGFEVWFLPPEFRRRDLVDPTETGIDDPDILTILNTMREEEITIESILLARNVLTGLEAVIGDRSPNRGLREESWYVVRNAKMPSILIEVGFVTHPEESRRLEEDRYLEEITRGIYTGITNFVRSYEELGRE